MQVLRDHESSISIKGLSDMTAIKTDDIISTLQHLQLIQYQKGQHVIYGAPASLERYVAMQGASPSWPARVHAILCRQLPGPSAHCKPPFLASTHCG